MNVKTVTENVLKFRILHRKYIIILMGTGKIFVISKLFILNLRNCILADSGGDPEQIQAPLWLQSTKCRF